jgi:preprotein translocase subunit Sss1
LEDELLELISEKDEKETEYEKEVDKKIKCLRKPKSEEIKMLLGAVGLGLAIGI